MTVECNKIVCLMKEVCPAWREQDVDQGRRTDVTGMADVDDERVSG
jgi:hypothetical protein